jgi:hypothetical protein
MNATLFSPVTLVRTVIGRQVGGHPEEPNARSRGHSLLTVEAWIDPGTLRFPHEQGTGYVYVPGKGATGKQKYALRMYSHSTLKFRCGRIVYRPTRSICQRPRLRLIFAGSSYGWAMDDGHIHY